MSTYLKRRALFIDFDGILHATSGSDPSRHPFVWVPVLLEMLQDHGDVGIVAHSPTRETSQADFLRHKCAIPSSRWLGITPPHLPRWVSIEAWLDAHQDIHDHLILDGHPSEFPIPAPLQLILCDERLGVSDDNVQSKIRQWLTNGHGSHEATAPTFPLPPTIARISKNRT